MVLDKFEKLIKPMLEFDPNFKYEKSDDIQSSEKILGFIITQRLGFDNHIEQLAQKMHGLFKEFI